VQPGWSPDGSQVWYIDRPGPAAPSGLWAVPAEGGAEPQFVTDRLGTYSADRALLAYPAGGETFVERMAGEGAGQRWAVGNAGRPVEFSPDGTRLAWQSASASRNFDKRIVSVWLANVDGSGAHVAAQLQGGSLLGWLPDGQHLLVSQRDLAADLVELAALDAATGTLTPILREPQVRSVLVSPGGGWLAYLVSFSGDTERDGIWVARADGSGAWRLPLFGAYRWRSEGRLLLVPLEPGAGSQRVVEFDAATGSGRPLTNPGQTPLAIANGDWSLSPDGRRFVYVNAADRNLWILDLPE
jgi:dipeptidyl aminopeptidase/acylaminoacyl peptidase